MVLKIHTENEDKIHNTYIFRVMVLMSEVFSLLLNSKFIIWILRNMKLTKGNKLSYYFTMYTLCLQSASGNISEWNKGEKGHDKITYTYTFIFRQIQQYRCK